MESGKDPTGPAGAGAPAAKPTSSAPAAATEAAATAAQAGGRGPSSSGAVPGGAAGGSGAAAPAAAPRPGAAAPSGAGGGAATSSAAPAAAAAEQQSPRVAASAPGTGGRRRLLDSDDESPLRPRGKKSKLMSDSSDEDVVLGKMHIAPPRTQSEAAAPKAATATGGAAAPAPQQKQQQNGTNRAPAPAKPKPAAKARRPSGSDSSSDSGSSSGSSSGSGSSGSDSSSSGSSSSSSSSESSSSESSSDEESDARSRSRAKQGRSPNKKKQMAKTKGTRQRQAKAEGSKPRGVRPPPARRKTDAADSDEEGDEQEINMGTFDPKKRSLKDRLVAQFLRRWWYAWPQWPPADFDYSKELEKRKLKWVSLEEYEDLDDVDKNGYTKVYQISAFPGVFRDPHGNAIDLRPEEGRPSYKNARQLSELQLLELIAKAIRGQMTALQKSPFDETALQRSLQQELEEVESEYKQMQRRADAAKGRP
ncbi:uncharacterized protein EMH_0055570 [Eimeria mitis]|uniref:Uncharacterized protein n=1 Tax=Eimeria mitis TaxID=44415 RepID=U6K6V2_9EIME|nr:uncharacterized protein EMH_0055570 [Eimeria mitis]CDJ33699.1 hypothetical protein, conserved [Eimeria mitis]